MAYTRDDLEYGRAFLPADVPPGNTATATIGLVAPARAGVYHVELDLVCERVCWFAQRGSQPAWVRIDVLPS